MTQFQQWCIWEVDQLAKDAIQVSHRSLYLKLQKAYVTVCRNRQDILEVYNFWAFASVKILQQEAVSAKQRRQDNAFSPEVPALSFASRVSYLQRNFSDDQLLAFAWGPVFLWQLQWWFAHLGWPTP